LSIIAIGQIIETLKGEVENINRERKYKVTIKKKSYEVFLHPDPEGGGYWIECPGLPGCASQGDTVEEALDMIRDAIAGHLEVVEENEAGKASA